MGGLSEIAVKCISDDHKSLFVRQPFTALESSLSDACQTVGNPDGGQVPIADTRHAVGYRDSVQARTAVKRIVFYPCYTVGDRDGGQALTTGKRIFFYPYYTIGNGDGSKAGTVGKGRISDTCYTVGKGHGGKVGMFAECKTSDIRHGFSVDGGGDGNL